MKAKITSDILINATPSQVWAVLTDFSNYPNYGIFIKSLVGDVHVGNKFVVKMKSEGSSAMTFKPTVLAFEKNKEFRWLGNLLFKGLFDGEHSFVLKDNGNGTTTLIQGESFSGILVPFLKKTIHVDTLNNFHDMNRKIKKLVEG